MQYATQASAMRRLLDKHMPEKSGEYKTLANDAERTEWLLEYVIDASSGGFLGKNFTELWRTRLNGVQKGESKQSGHVMYQNCNR